MGGTRDVIAIYYEEFQRLLSCEYEMYNMRTDRGSTRKKFLGGCQVSRCRVRNVKSNQHAPPLEELAVQCVILDLTTVLNFSVGVFWHVLYELA